MPFIEISPKQQFRLYLLAAFEQPRAVWDAAYAVYINSDRELKPCLTNVYLYVRKWRSCGWLKRCEMRNPVNKRETLYMLTPKGREALGADLASCQKVITACAELAKGESYLPFTKKPRVPHNL